MPRLKTNLPRRARGPAVALDTSPIGHPDAPNCPERIQALVCMMASAAKAKMIAEPEPDAFDAAAHPDAKLLAMCAEIVAATKATGRMQFSGDLSKWLDQADAPKSRMKNFMGLFRIQEKLVAEATKLPATTLAGVQAKARAFRFLYEQVEGGKNASTRSLIDDLVRLSSTQRGEARV